MVEDVKKTRRTKKIATAAENLPQHVPPHDLDMERVVLGSVMLDPEVFDDVVMLLREQDFYLEQHQILFHEMEELSRANRQIDEMILINHLRNVKKLQQVGGVEYLAEILHSAPHAAHAKAYAEILRDKAKLRQLIHASNAILQSAYEPDVEIDKLVSQAEEKIFAVHDERSNDSVADIHMVLDEVWTKIDIFSREGGSVGIPTGFIRLDELTGGLHNSELIILAARPSMGKTAFATNIADSVAIAQNRGVLFVSLEMARQELVMRLLCGRAKVDSQQLRRGRLSRSEKSSLQEASSQMMDAPFFIDDSPSRTVSEIAATARRLKRQGKLSLIIIDYLQLIKEDNSRDSRQEQVSKIARRLKGLAREMDVPVICLSQLNRQTEATGDHRPKLSQLRESGAIEQDADVVMFVHREEYYHAGDRDYIEKKQLAGKAEIIIAKQRNGPTDTIPLAWIAKQTKFENLASPVYQDLEEFSEYE
ncbi:MAG: replicative DNA helicase [Planctomycetia bacterium]|nr:replicative DNA helicase [Planctomycetia bacterium]